jgi:hypothetical protein
MPDQYGRLDMDAVDWLLEPNNPSVRYLTLLNILDRRPADHEVKHARREIMLSGVVPKILAKQSEGRWNTAGRFYVDKYTGTVWQLIILAEHEADGNDERIQAACEYILRCSQDPDSHGFAYYQRGENDGGRHDAVVPCLTGNMLWSLLKLGYQKDERVKKGIEWITKYQRFDDGEGIKPAGWPYDRFEMCWGRHSCHMGVVKTLKALSAIPKGQRNKEINETIAKGCEYLLAHHIYKKSHDLTQTAKPGWRKLQFPLMYQTDILEIAGILTDLGVRDYRLKEAIELIAQKQMGDGRWNLESTFNGRFQVNIETKGKASKWITYRALKLLRKHYGLSA